MFLDNFIYQPSSSFKLDSTDINQVRSYEEQGLFPIQLPDGKFLISIPARMDVEFFIEGQRHVESVKELIKQCYNMKKVTKQSLAKFYNDCNNGIINLEYSDKDGLYIV